MDDTKQHLSDEEYIECKIEQTQDTPEQAALLNTVATLLMQRANDTGQEKDVDRSISASERV